MAVVTCIEDLRRLHESRTPRMFYDYCDSGSWTESTYRANTTDFDKIKLHQRVAKNVSDRKLITAMLGRKVTMPVALSPTGFAGMQHADGEILAARAAEKFGVPFCLSTMSICSIEDVAAHTTKPFWFQLYVMKDRTFIGRLIDRAKVAGCSALVLTLDLQVMGQRHKDIHNGLSAPPKLTAKNVFNMMTKPKWCWNMLRTKRRNFGNIIGHTESVTDMGSLAAWTAEQFDTTMTWHDIEWIKKRWGGPLVLKGILHRDDAKLARDTGADAIVVSNHGGRQLDGAVSTIMALPSVVAAVGKDCEVWLDSGIRSGQDVLKAWALGARGTMIGRAFLHGLGAMGEQGVTKCLEIIHSELDTTMALTGHRDINDVGNDILIGYTTPSSVVV